MFLCPTLNQHLRGRQGQTRWRKPRKQPAAACPCPRCPPLLWSGRPAEGADLVFVGAQSCQAEVRATRRCPRLEELEQAILVASLELDRDQETAHEAGLEPVEQQVDAALWGGNDVTEKPVDRFRGTELEGVTLMKLQARMAHEIFAQGAAIHSSDAGSALQGNVAPAAR